MEGAAQATDFVPAIVVINSVVIAGGLVVAGRYLAARSLTSGVPEGRQVFATLAVRENLLLGATVQYRRGRRAEVEADLARA
jgi:ABC-type branched-subunit amino acid transport system ATPase component